jgi:peptidoglycan/LPS O-acetylase OafA/YrhL
MSHSARSEPEEMTAGDAEAASGTRSSKIRDYLRALPERIGRPPSTGAYIPQVDGLRFLAIFIVVVWHASLRASRYARDLSPDATNPANWYGYFPHGEIGVVAFFFISGYIIAQPYFRPQTRRYSALLFYSKRLRRIVPPYLVVLIAGFLSLTVMGYKPVSANSFELSPVPMSESVAASAVYLHSLIFNSPSRIDPPMWSLEIEMQFYLLFPCVILIYTFVSSRHRLLYGALIIILTVILANVCYGLYGFDGRYRWGLLKHAGAFLTGIVVADAEASKPKPAVRGIYDWLWLGGLALLLLIGLSMTEVDTLYASAVSSFLADVGSLLAVVAIFYGAMYGKLGRRVFGAPWLCLIGTMCYSIYLVHVPLMQVVSDVVLRRLALHSAPAIWGVWLLVLLPVSFVCAAVFYVLVERPFMNRRQRR